MWMVLVVVRALTYPPRELQLHHHHQHMRLSSNIPNVAGAVDGAKWDTAIKDLKIGLELQDEIALDSAWDGLAKAGDFVVSNDSPSLDR